jgi:hypothetical protein
MLFVIMFVPLAISSSHGTLYKYHLIFLHNFVSRTVWNKRTFTAVSKRSHYSSVSVVTRLWAKLRCHSSIPGRGKSFVSCCAQPHWLWGSTEPPTQWAPGSSWLGHEADQTPSSDVSVKS